MAGACQPSGPTEIRTQDEGRVLQWQGTGLLVLVSGLQDSYAAGDTIHLTLLVNNQGTELIQVKLLTKVLGTGDQPVIQAQPVILSVDSEDAQRQKQDVPIRRDLPTGDYTLAVEVPPWTVADRQVGPGATLRGGIHIGPAA